MVHYRPERFSVAWWGELMNKPLTRYNRDRSLYVPEEQKPGRFYKWLLKPVDKTSEKIILGFLVVIVIIQFALVLG